MTVFPSGEPPDFPLKNEMTRWVRTAKPGTEGRQGQIALGLRENWPQFGLLVLINAFVGGMVGLERTVLPLLGWDLLGVGSETVVFSFVVAFGLVKAFTNVASGVLADRFSRRSVLVTGWLVALPVPLMLAWGPTWNWVIAANILLGVSQGLAWSMTVNMKIDLVGPKRRGLAMGLNEGAGYVALGLTALLTGYIATQAGLRPEPFYLGIGYALLGLVLSIALVRDTGAHVALEARSRGAGEQAESRPSGLWVFAETTWRNRTLLSVTQAGLVNNLNDGVSWVVFPLLFAGAGLKLEAIGIIVALYPIIWGVGQAVTGGLSDRFGRKPLIVAGMLLQAAGLFVVAFGLGAPLAAGAAGSTLLGIGTALAYPSLLAAAGDASHPLWRATTVGVYRFWRDMGYAVGALMAGLVAAALGLVWAIQLAGLLTLVSGVVSWRLMKETSNEN